MTSSTEVCNFATKSMSLFRFNCRSSRATTATLVPRRPHDDVGPHGASDLQARPRSAPVPAGAAETRIRTFRAAPNRTTLHRLPGNPDKPRTIPRHHRQPHQLRPRLHKHGEEPHRLSEHVPRAVRTHDRKPPAEPPVVQPGESTVSGEALGELRGFNPELEQRRGGPVPAGRDLSCGVLPFRLHRGGLSDIQGAAAGGHADGGRRLREFAAEVGGAGESGEG